MIEYFKSINSTNIRCIQLGLNGADNYSIVIAEHQTQGRGRKGRSWSSEDSGGIYFSLLLRSKLDIDKVSIVTLVMAYSVARILQNMDLKCKIKWPNDIVMNGKKICGILTELQQDEEGEPFLVIGVGINANNIGFDSSLGDKATSIYIETGNRILCEDEAQRTAFVTEIAQQFRRDVLKVEQAGDLGPILDEYNELMANRNSEVKVLDPQGEYQAFAIGITPYGGLEVRLEDSGLTIITGGEVSVRGIMGYV